MLDHYLDHYLAAISRTLALTRILLSLLAVSPAHASTVVVPGLPSPSATTPLFTGCTTTPRTSHVYMCRCEPWSAVKSRENASEFGRIRASCDETCPPTWNSESASCYPGHRTKVQIFDAHRAHGGMLQWTVFFLAAGVIMASACKILFPAWLPYTAGILTIGILLGIGTQLALVRDWCPVHALDHDRDGDGAIDRIEWDEFICANCTAASFCVAHKEPHLGGSRTCGDGSASGGGRCLRFDDLDAEWSPTLMYASAVNALGGNGRLEADELWHWRCNIMADMWSLRDMDPHVLLVVFLPSLLFQSAAFEIEMGIFKQQLSQILLLAIPAMVISSLVAGGLVYMAYPEWPFKIAWLAGTVVSATDPVSVVALLSQLGARTTLSTLIEGESLLNDGTVVVLFTWLMHWLGFEETRTTPSWLGGTQVPWIELLRLVAQMLCLGLLLGLAFGGALVMTLQRVHNDRFVETGLLIGTSYLLFWLAELIMRCSAIIAVVVLGLIINHHKASISVEVHGFLRQFYSMLGHFLNTIIFLIAGVKLGVLFTQMRAIHSGAKTILIYPIILAARAIAIALLFPLLRRLGTGYTWQEGVIAWWGGLRGAVSLALAMAVHQTQYSHLVWGGQGSATETGGYLQCRDAPDAILYMTTVAVALTVIVNGTLMSQLMRLLEMSEPPPNRKLMLRRAEEKMEKKYRRMLEAMRNDYRQNVSYNP